MVKSKSNKCQDLQPKTVRIYNKNNQLISRISYYPSGIIKHIYKYSPTSKYKLIESIGYSKNGKICSLRRFYTQSGRCFENFKLQSNGYFRDMTKKILTNYFKFKENFDNNDYYLTVKAYNITNDQILKHNTMFFKNNCLYREKMYNEDGQLISDQLTEI